MDKERELAAARKVGEYGGYIEVTWLTELDGRSVYELHRPGSRRHGCVGAPFLVSVGDDGVGYELDSEQFHRVMASL